MALEDHPTVRRISQQQLPYLNAQVLDAGYLRHLAWTMVQTTLGWSKSVDPPSIRNGLKFSKIIHGPSPCWLSWCEWRENRCVVPLVQSPIWSSIAQAMKSTRSAQQWLPIWKLAEFARRILQWASQWRCIRPAPELYG
jgi:hypothetical protein